MQPQPNHLSAIGANTRILFVWPTVRISVWDVATGYRAALARLVGAANIRDYRLDLWSEYHLRAMRADPGIPQGKEAEEGNKVDLALRASQGIINDVYYHNADLVFIITGFGVHPAVAWTLHRMGIPSVVLLTESPYDDANQADWVTSNPDMQVLTTERYSADRYGWTYAPHSFDPAVHHPREPIEADRCDVLIVGTGWKERHQLIDAIDWSGIDLRLCGFWPDIEPGSMLATFHHPGFVPNYRVAEMYSGARIILNVHRYHPDARSLGPRVFEAAACGAFQITDWRAELASEFGDTIPAFAFDPGAVTDSATHLGSLIRWFLLHNEDRADRARAAHRRVQPRTFDSRLAALVPYGARTGVGVEVA